MAELSDEFIPDYHHLIDTLRAVNPQVRILIARTTPIGVEHPRFESGTRDWQLQIQQAIEQVAKSADIELIDFHTPLYPYPHYFPDAVPPHSSWYALPRRDCLPSYLG